MFLIKYECPKWQWKKLMLTPGRLCKTCTATIQYCNVSFHRTQRSHIAHRRLVSRKKIAFLSHTQPTGKDEQARHHCRPPLRNCSNINLHGSPILPAFQRTAEQRQHTAAPANVAAHPPTPAPRTETTGNDGEQPFVPTTRAPIKKKANLVLSRGDKTRILLFMVTGHTQNGKKHLPSKTVDQFRTIFKGSRQEAIMKSMRLWK